MFGVAVETGQVGGVPFACEEGVQVGGLLVGEGGRLRLLDAIACVGDGVLVIDQVCVLPVEFGERILGEDHVGVCLLVFGEQAVFLCLEGAQDVAGGEDAASFGL